MAGRNVFSSMSLIQATITFVVAFLAAIAAPLWYFFIRWMRSRNA
jgi:hypothetical protein